MKNLVALKMFRKNNKMERKRPPDKALCLIIEKEGYRLTLAVYDAKKRLFTPSDNTAPIPLTKIKAWMTENYVKGLIIDVVNQSKKKYK